MNSYTLRKGKEWKGKVAKKYWEKRNEYIGEEKLQGKEGKGILKFVSCLITPLCSMKKKFAERKRTKQNFLREEHRTQNPKDNL